MSRHGALTLVLKIKDGQKEQLTKKCESYNTGKEIPFHLINGLHYARFVILDEGKTDDGIPYDAQLIFASNYDLPHKAHFKELSNHLGTFLWDIFSHCEGSPTGNFDADQLCSFLETSNFKATTFYVGVGLRSVDQIRNENLLRTEIIDYLGSNGNITSGKSAVEIREEIIKQIHSKPEFEWAKEKAKGRSFIENIAFYGKFVIALLLFIALLPLIIPFLIVWMILLRIKEKKENRNYKALDVPKEHIRILVERENNIVQEQFSAAGNVKKGFIRRNTMRFLLWITDKLAPLIFSKGKLSGIPTVHFARWLLIHDKKQMVFLSNYDGNTETYLHDFINIAAKQLTLLFTHTTGYPKTHFLAFAGAKDANGFMDWARKSQVITDIWYSANPEVSLKNIWNNGKIRAGMYGRMNEKKAKRWLQKI